MTATTMFSTPASFLSFVSVQESSGVPKLEDFVWGSNDATNSMGTTTDFGHGDVLDNGERNNYPCIKISANYLILGFENEHFSGAYVAFPGRGSFDTTTEIFLARYGEPTSNDDQALCRYWVGEDLNVRLQYHGDTDEGILAITYQELDDAAGSWPLVATANLGVLMTLALLLPCRLCYYRKVMV